MTDQRNSWLTRIDRAIWMPPLAPLPVWKARAVRIIRLAIVLSRDVIQGQLTLWTMSLVYTTLLSIVPLLALSFSVLKAFGVHNQIEPLLKNFLAPLGEQGHEISSRLIGFIAHMNVGVLGAVGLGMLIYTVISLMQKIEESFNAIWHVTQLRSLGDRFSRYLSVLMVGPILVFTAVGLTTMAVRTDAVQAILAVEPFGILVLALANFLPYALIVGAFTFIYMFVPNTGVRFVPAFVAAIVGGVLWQSAGWAFALFVASSTQYAAIYASFAVLLLFLIWLYVSWLVLLFGAALSFYLQHPDYLYAMPGEPRLSNRMRERLALAVMHLIGLHFLQGRPPWTLRRLTQQLRIPMHSVNVALDAMVRAGLVMPNGSSPPAYLPGRDLSQISIAEVLAIIRRTGEDGFLNPDALPLPESAQNILMRIEDALSSSLGELSVRAMLDGPVGPPAASPPAAAPR
ncbi:MAG: YhjD/YihY/BrkB family envelope integrity protein [Casimicrobiaceae bacterium]